MTTDATMRHFQMLTEIKETQSQEMTLKTENPLETCNEHEDSRRFHNSD